MTHFSIPLLAVLLLASPAKVLPVEINAADPKAIEPTIAATTASPAELVIIAVGDIMLDGTARPTLTKQHLIRIMTLKFWSS